MRLGSEVPVGTIRYRTYLFYRRLLGGVYTAPNACPQDPLSVH